MVERFLLVASAFGAGLALGLLLAPQTGSETRTQLASGARDAATAAQDRSRDIAAPVAERARQTAHDLAQRHLPLADDFDIIDPETVKDAVRESGL